MLDSYSIHKCSWPEVVWTLECLKTHRWCSQNIDVRQHLLRANHQRRLLPALQPHQPHQHITITDEIKSMSQWTDHQRTSCNYWKKYWVHLVKSCIVQEYNRKFMHACLNGPGGDESLVTLLPNKWHKMTARQCHWNQLKLSDHKTENTSASKMQD